MEALERRFKFLEETMAVYPGGDVYRKLASEYAELELLVRHIRLLTLARREEEDVNVMLTDPRTDINMRVLAEEERSCLRAKICELEKTLSTLLLPKDVADDRNVILEIRAGTGGLEAALFSGDLFRMYERYAVYQGWKVEMISMSEADLGGYKEIIAGISGKSVFSRLKFESGVHRVQRVPETEASGRIHTSAATVAVLPEAEDIDIEIHLEDIRIDTMRASGAGGQHVNTTDSAVRMTHIPTGITVIQAEKSQHQNRARAMQILRARLYDMKRSQIAKERSAFRKEQVGSGDRSERIRTYNFPQSRITDHRINLTLYKLDQLMEGYLDEIIEPLIADHKAGLLGQIGVEK